MPFRIGAFVALPALALAACGDTVVVSPTPAPNTAIVRFVNATGSAMDFVANGQVATGNAKLGYGSSSSCTVVGTGTSHRIAVYQPGTTVEVPGLDSTLQAGKRYTILASPGPSTAGPRFLTVPYSFTPDLNSAGMNVVHVAGGDARYDVYVSTPGSTSLGQASARGLAAGSSSSYFNVPQGAQQVQLMPAGSQSVSVDAGSLTFTPATSLSLVVAPPAAGSSAPRYFWVLGC